MRELLKEKFLFYGQYETKLLGFPAYKGSDGYAIVIPADYIDEDFITEQYVIADYLNQSGFTHVAKPLYSNEGKFIVPINEESSIYTCHVQSVPSSSEDPQQFISFLTSFHQAGHGFPYSPINLNRYGQWKTNWEQIIDQLEWIRNMIIEKPYITDWERLWLESCFYFIGMGENAIQFLQESEQENLYNQYDQPVFTFERISPFPHQEVIFPNRIIHDHPSRDLSEMMRYYIMEKGAKGFPIISNMLDVYQNKRPISVFGWRLLFSRLAFPIHFIDYTEKVLTKEKITQDDYEEFQKRLANQYHYEEGLQFAAQEMERSLGMDLEVMDWIFNNR
ncbi:spore coat protein YutH [Salinibacillus kushneri]|uniref:Spore coat protein YutH n=1 Tax=Salinibacillus kushneri TaxID=237682 RepID=A0A1H9Y9N7_9BACI|nr:hypothetical protein [Salinibacillus kushneri]SES65145.1 spore coat protein YutH [Salinibacillus kushneri]